MLLSFFSSCSPFSKSANDVRSSSNLADVTPKSCIFCNVTKEKGFNIVWEDNTFIAFGDQKPAAKQHLLVIPKSHIPSVKSLNETDVDLVQSMEKIGHRILEDLGVPSSLRRMGYHIPPFNSVDHLHLHVQGLPYVPFFKEAKYVMVAPASGRFSKGTSSFVEVGQTIRILENGGRVGFFPC